MANRCRSRDRQHDRYRNIHHVWFHRTRQGFSLTMGAILEVNPAASWGPGRRVVPGAGASEGETVVLADGALVKSNMSSSVLALASRAVR